MSLTTENKFSIKFHKHRINHIENCQQCQKLIKEHMGILF